MESEEEDKSRGESACDGDADVARDDPQDMRTLRAERHADSELVGALRDGVGDDAVESDEREGDRREEREEDGGEALLLVFRRREKYIVKPSDSRR